MKKVVAVCAIALGSVGAGIGVAQAYNVTSAGGGTWTYGLDDGSFDSSQSRNMSEYNHGSLDHSASVSNCNGTVNSGWYQAGNSAQAVQPRCWTGGNQAFWNTNDGNSGSDTYGGGGGDTDF